MDIKINFQLLLVFEGLLEKGRFMGCDRGLGREKNKPKTIQGRPTTQHKNFQTSSCSDSNHPFPKSAGNIYTVFTVSDVSSYLNTFAIFLFAVYLSTHSASQAAYSCPLFLKILFGFVKKKKKQRKSQRFQLTQKQKTVAKLN